MQSQTLQPTNTKKTKTKEEMRDLLTLFSGLLVSFLNVVATSVFGNTSSRSNQIQILRIKE